MHDNLVHERWRLLDQELLDWSCQQGAGDDTRAETTGVAATSVTATSKDELSARSPMLTSLQTLSSSESTDDGVEIPKSVREYAQTLLNTLTMLQHSIQVGESATLSITSLLDITMGDDTDANAEQRHLLQHARWWLLGMIVSVMHVRVLERIMSATQPLSSSMTYWGRRIDSPRWAAIYLLQTTPQRVFNWISSLHPTASLHPSAAIEGLTGRIGIYVRHITSHLPWWPAQGWLSLAQREAGLKRNRLNETRRRYAVGLGYLAEQGQLSMSQFNRQNHALASGENDDDGQNRGESLHLDGVDQIRYLLSQLLHCTQQAMRVVLEDSNEKVAIANALTTVNDATLHLLTAEEVRFNLLALEEDLQKFNYMNSRVLQVNGRPDFLTRYWPTIGIGMVAGPSLLSFLVMKRRTIVHWIGEMKHTVQDFLIEWVWRPVQNIYETVRHREGRLNIMGKASLAADLDSLERMVIDLVQEKGQLNEQELNVIRQTVRDGDLTMVLREYEREMKTPLKSALLGHLIRVLLIQVQKGKVDLELAMAALDKLLRANELNFAFLTAAPVLLITFGMTRWLRTVWYRRRGLSAGVAQQEACDWLRRTDRVLNRHSDSAVSTLNYDNEPARQNRIASMSKSMYQAHGLVLCNTHRLRVLLPRLALSDPMQREFLMDLRELEDTQMSSRQRLGTLHRMYRTYGFLMGQAAMN
ncbi:ATP synthase regulation protein NCA2-domain-containing protein [Syncephalis plumigaleata]|nr:ATP synthase regulation protein NCA2-domain-containing protein [Syncephalis plumigaleata]